MQNQVVILRSVWKVKFTEYCTCAAKNPGPHEQLSRQWQGFSFIFELEPYMLKTYSGKSYYYCKSGNLKSWKCWNMCVPRILKFWNLKFLKFWHFEMLKLWNFKFGKSRILKKWKRRVPENMNIRLIIFRNLEYGIKIFLKAWNENVW